MHGGIPEVLTGIFQCGSIGLLGIAVYLAMPRRWAIWVRAMLTLLQMVVAAVLMCFGWFVYVLQNGIDTL